MNQSIDKTSFTATIAAIFLVSVPLILSPQVGAELLQTMYQWIATQFGVLYIAAGCGAILFLLYLAFSRFGHIMLGEPGEKPEFSTYSWMGMLFCAGVGAGLMYWASIEWAYYYQSPPFGVEAKSVEAAKWASSYGVFHWGVTAWAFYCIPTLAIAYPFYVKKIPYLRFSLSCHYFLKGNENGPVARFIDFLFMIALVGGTGSSLGFSTPLVAALISRLTGIENGFGLELFVVGICVMLFSASVFMGIRKGIKRLSDFNVALAILIVAFILVAGPTLFLLKTSLNVFGTVAQNFIQMNTWTDPFTESGFVEDWTVFYWAWWIAYGPFVGLFVTRISRGRTIREVIFGMLGYGTLGAAIFYLSMGNYALFQQMSGSVDVIGILTTQDGNLAIIASLNTLPIAEIVIAAFCVVCIIFTATTYDSASYILASNATLNLHPSEDPARWHRTFWAGAIAILPLTLMYIGGLKVAQTAVLIVSLPILFVGFAMCYALIASLKSDYPAPVD
ncbi:MAG: BCCT family transporter [Pseudomonadales bacterium]